MTKRTRPASREIIIILTSLCLLVSCSGSSSNTAAGGGIGGTGYTSSGTITALGSVVVNGVRYDTTNAGVIAGGRSKGTGNQVILENLDVGQVVLVEGSVNNNGSSGVASTVFFTPHVRGPVASVEDVSQNLKIFKVLGQTIIAEESTVFRNTSIDDLTVDNLVEVSGLVDASGAIRATYIKKLADFFASSTEVEVKGIVQDPDSTAKTFGINDLTIYYGQANISNLPGMALISGLWVHVRGTVASNNFLLAAEVEPADENRITRADQVDLEGFVTDFSSASYFSVGSMGVQLSGDARFVAGLSEEVERGAKIRVKGRMLNGILQAQEIIFRDRVRLEATVVSKNSASKTLSLRTMNKVIKVTNLSRFMGPAKEFDQIQVGDYLRVRGRVWTEKTVLATMLRVIPSPPEPQMVVLQGAVEAINRPEIVILGITIDTSFISDNSFEGVGSANQREEFFSRVQIGSLVRAWGRAGTAGEVTWEGIALEEGN